MDPFVAALRRIEQESGRMIQAQIRLLKDGASPVPLDERGQILQDTQEAVDDAFRCFLEWLAGGRLPVAKDVVGGAHPRRDVVVA